MFWGYSFPGYSTKKIEDQVANFDKHDEKCAHACCLQAATYLMKKYDSRGDTGKLDRAEFFRVITEVEEVRTGRFIDDVDEDYLE